MANEKETQENQQQNKTAGAAPKKPAMNKKGRLHRKKVQNLSKAKRLPRNRRRVQKNRKALK